MDAFFAYTAVCHLAFKHSIKYAQLIVNKKYRMMGLCVIYCGQTLKIHKAGVSVQGVQGKQFTFFESHAKYAQKTEFLTFTIVGLEN